MNFQPSEDQRAFLDALGKVLAQTDLDIVDGRRSFFSARLDSALEDSGLFDAAAMDEFGPVAAAMLIEEVSRLPAIVELGASALVRPLVCPEWPRPLAIIEGDIAGPARFLCEARTVLFVSGSEIRLGRLGEDACVAAEAFFAYPMGRLKDPPAVYARSEPAGASCEVRRLIAIATSCEIAGALHGALAAVTDHVTARRQFGRPLGSFQAVQHRLAKAATDIAASRLLALRAADRGGMDDALMALGFAQDCAVRIVHDLHQFMGAMGLTLEHPLYRWTYRVKRLANEWGSAFRQFRDASERLWGDVPEDPSGDRRVAG
ncbi:MAG: acyl-CoA dehydrogenase family protein [Microvirga sp.]